MAISEQERSNLVKTNELFDLLLISHDWYWEVDLHGFIQKSVGQLPQLLGYSNEEMIGKPIFMYMKKNHSLNLKKEFDANVQLEKPISLNLLERVSKSKKSIFTSLNACLFFDKELKCKMYRGIEKNFTNYVKEKEDALLKAKEKSLFLAKMSHEIRTPMNGIIGTAELLKDSILNNEQKDLLSIIDVSANNLLSIINDILDISKLEAGKINLEKEAFNIYNLVAEVIKMLSVRVVKNEVKLIADIDPEVPKTLYGDALRLKQIIINFVNNAIKFTKKGSVTIAIQILKNQADEIKLKIEVIDTGIGISEIGLTKLFQEFSQVDQSMYKKFGGTGLGLMISKKLSELMGGVIGVESNINKGSIFWINISFQKMIEKTKLDIDNEMDNLSSSPRQLKVLVAEDNMINQKVAMINLRQLGHNVEIASNGQVAFDMFQNGEYDIILMDIQMPVLDGIEATVAIRKYEKENNIDKIRIVAITANAQKEDRNRCFEVGMDDFITKPFKPDDLIRILNF
jgi:signal transduction histidine kinase/CheY-like chemotaxis protein